jgi:5-(aminomethyl)-3-furanmethanol phosphate kinase
MKIDVVVKVGGSLYDLPDLGDRLGAWLRELPKSKFVLVPGGGAAADLVRAWDQRQHMGEETAHWLALRALTFNAHFLASRLAGSRVIKNLDETGAASIPILDMHAWATMVERRGNRFPHTWQVTSDSLAAHVAIVSKAAQLILLKSVRLPEGMNWHEAARQGIVDSYFPQAISLAPAGLQIRVVPFR